MDVGKLVAYLSVDSTAFDRALTSAGQKFKTVGSIAGTVGKATATSLVAGTAAATALGVQMVKTGAQYNILQQNSRAALKTLLGSTEAVNKQMEKLDDLASKSPFSKSVFIEGQQSLLAFGMQAEKVIPTLNAVQNAVAATGGSGQQLSDLVFVMAQIQAAGKITGQDLLQMGQRGVNAAELIGEAMGLSVAEVKDAISKNQITATDALDAITAGMTRKFGGATDNIKQQWTGAADRIKASWRDMGATIAKPFIDPNGGGQAVVWANLVADIMRQVGKHVTLGMQVVESRAGSTFTTVTRGLQKASELVARFQFKNLVEQFDSLRGVAPVVAGVGTAIATLGGANIPILQHLVGKVNPLVAGLLALGATSPEIRRVGGEFVRALQPAVPVVMELGKSVAEFLMRAITALAPHLENVARGAGNLIAGLAPLGRVALTIAEGFFPLVETAAALVGALASLPTPVLTAVTAMVALHSPVAGVAKGLAGLLDPATRAGGAIAGFIGSVKNVGVLGTFKNGIAGIGNMITGLVSPVGLATAALGVLVAVIGHYVQKQAEARQAAADFKNALDAETGAITDNTRAHVAQQAEAKGLLEAVEKLGGSSELLMRAVLGEADAREQLNALLESNRAKVAELATATGEEHLRGLELRDALNLVNEGYQEMATATDEGTAAKRRELEASRAVTDQLDNQSRATENLLEAQRKQAAANGDYIAANYATKDSFSKLREEAEKLGKNIDLVNGLVSEGSDVNKSFILSAKESADAINRQMDAYVRQGHTQDEITAKLAELTQGFYDQMTATGLSSDAVEKFANSVGLVANYDSIVIDFTVADEEAKKQIAGLVKDIGDKQGVITIAADSDPAGKELAKALGAVEDSTGNLTIDAVKDPALAELLVAQGIINTSSGTLRINGNNEALLAAVQSGKATVDRTTGTIKVYGKDYASEEAQRIVAYINSMRATIKTRVQQVGNSYNPALDRFANGGVVDYYATGGIRERHTAQIAPAGAWRVWAEPETGGEAYIPLSTTKRARSEQILAQVANRFGGVFIKNKPQRYADGGVTTPIQPAVNLAGMSITGRLEIGGDGLARLIDGRIIQAINA